MPSAGDMFAQIQQANRETAAFKDLLKFAGLSKRVVNRYYDLLRGCSGGQGGSPLEAWHQAFPDFPVNFQVAVEEKLKDFGKLHNFFSASKRRAEALRYITTIESAQSRDRVLGLLCKLAFVPAHCVIHNAGVPGDFSSPVFLMFAVNEEPPFDQQLILEPLSTFMERIRPTISSWESGWIGS